MFGDIQLQSKLFKSGLLAKLADFQLFGINKSNKSNQNCSSLFNVSSSFPKYKHFILKIQPHHGKHL